jgi:hypothetical protein
MMKAKKVSATSLHILYRLVSLVIGLLLIPTPFVRADSPPPPSKMWLTFEYQTSQPVEIEGIQIIQCATQSCDNPILLQQYGVCDSGGCFSSDHRPEGLGDWYDIFECNNDKCYIASDLYCGSYFKLVVQFSDGVRTSKADGQLPEDYWGERREVGWRITVTDTALLVAADEDYKPQTLPFGLLMIGFAVTQIAELLVAAICLKFWLRSTNLLNDLVMIFWCNLVTFPLVWLFFPSLAQFRSTGDRGLGLAALIVATALGGLLVFIHRANNSSQRWRRIGIAVFTVFILSICASGGIALASYRDFSRSPVGLPPFLILPLSELSAVIIEAALLTTMSKGRISLKQAGSLSMIINTVSLAIGLIATGVNIV